MSDTTISINPDDAAAAVNLILKNREATVDVRAQLSSEGVGQGAASSFKSSLNNYVNDVKASMLKIQNDLLTLHENVTQTVVELGEQDATLATQTETFLAGVEEVPVPPAAAASGAKPMGDGSAAKTIV